MKHKSIISSFVFGLALSACVTINIYFPAAAAEDAARVIVRDVLNDEQVEIKKENNEQSFYQQPESFGYLVITSLLAFFR